MSTGWVCDERYFWHDPGLQPGRWVEPLTHYDDPAPKRRTANLVAASGLADRLVHVTPQPAEYDQLVRVHDAAHVHRLMQANATGGVADDLLSRFEPGGIDIARLAAGGAIAAAEAVLDGLVDNAYALVRPPGHHATVTQSMGYCLFNNIALAIRHLRATRRLTRVAVVDWDVHHGNGTQEIFWDDPTVLTVSMHQDRLYPADSGLASEVGGAGAEGTCLNVPLPAGSGTQAYLSAFEAVVSPAVRAFEPELVVVACGYDASALDPMGRMELHSDAYRWLTAGVMDLADALCGGRVLAVHEGGYSPLYVPFCGLAVMEQLSGVRTEVTDPWLAAIRARPGQDWPTP